VEQFPDINKLCNVASCWIYEYIGILLGAHPILHISRIRVNLESENCTQTRLRFGYEKCEKLNAISKTFYRTGK
jgi:hypothetical protein